MWEIYSIGDSAFLAAVLNGVALIAGTGALAKLASIGFLLAVFVTAFQGLMADGGPAFPYQRVLVAMVLYLLLYGPTARVAIEDAYTGTVRTVDNVPLGVAATGSLVSSVGYQLTRLFEQGFGTPTLTGEGFGSSMALLLNSRQATFGRANAGGGGDVRRTLIEYLKDCTLIGLDLGFIGEQALQTAPDALQAIRWDSRWYATLTFLPGDPATGAERDCTDAYTALSQHLNSGAFRAAWEAHLTGLYGANPFSRAQAALDALVGIGQDARTVMLNNVLAGLYLEGARAKHLFEGDVAAALITESAIAQRNTQWATERALFMRMVRPMLAAIKGLMYAVTPLLAFLIALNGFGLGLLGQYLQMTFWIQLWLPILAIINLYINQVAQHDMAALATVQGIAPSSWLGLAHLQLSFADWLGTGSMLAASTPAIALFLVWGGSVTATNLASRMQSGDFIGEKTVAPDPVTTGPALELLPALTHNPTQGPVLTGAPGQTLPQFSREQVANASISSHQQEVQKASQQWLDTLASSAQRSFASQVGTSSGQTLSQSLSASHSAVDQYIYKAAQETLRQSGVEHVSADQLTGAVALSGGDLLKIGPSLQSQYHTSQQDAQALQDAFSREVGGQENYQAEIGRKIAQDAQSGLSTAYSKNLGLEDQSTLAKQSADLLEKSHSLDRALEASRSWRVGAPIGAETLGRELAANPVLFKALDIWVQEHGLAQAVALHASEYGVYGRALPNRDQAYAAAAMGVLLGQADTPGLTLSPRQQDANRDFGVQLWEQATGATPLRISRPEDVSVTGGLTYGTTSAKVEGAARPDPRPVAAALPGQVDTALQRETQTQAGAREWIQQQHYEDQNAVRTQREQEAGYLSAAQTEPLRQRLAQAATTARSPGQWMHDEIAGGIIAKASAGLSVMSDAVRSSWLGLIEGYRQASAAGASPLAALQQAWNDMGNGQQQALQGFYDGQLTHARQLGLTEPQAQLYAQSTMTTLAGLEHDLPTLGAAVRQVLTATGLSPDPAPLRQAVQTELQGDPPTGHIVTLLERAGRSHNDADLRTLGEFNQARGGHAADWRQAPQPGGVTPLPEPATFRHPAGATTVIRRVEADLAFRSHLVTLEQQYGLPPGLLTAVGLWESNWNAKATSHKDAGGLFQLMPETAQRFGVNDRYDKWESAAGAAQYLAWLSDRYQGDLSLTLAGYNAGEGTVDRYGRQVPPYPETQQYVTGVSRMLASIQEKMRG